MSQSPTSFDFLFLFILMIYICKYSGNLELIIKLKSPLPKLSMSHQKGLIFSYLYIYYFFYKFYDYQSLDCV
jgi:hypothetical protein